MALLRSVATVGSYTLVSRVFGFIRDILTAAILGAGPIADAFFVAQRLPNLFRSLFAEGAFNAAFVPLASGTLAEGGKPAVRAFAEEAFAVLFTVLFAFVLLGEIFMPWLMTVIAPGFSAEPGKFDLVVMLTRITFPYLLFISLTALQGGVLNTVDRFAAPAATPILLNLFLITGLVLMAHFHWQDGQVLAWALSAAALAQVLWLMASCARAGVALRLRVPRLMPGAAALIVLAQPIMTVLFERGAFGPVEAAATAAALGAYAAGLPAFVLVKVLAPGFFAHHDTATPVKIAIAAMITNLVLTLVLMQFWAHVGIATALSVAGWFQALALLVLLERRGHFRLDRRARSKLPRIVVAAIGMGAIVLALRLVLAPALVGPLMLRLAALSALIAAGVIVFAVLALALGVTGWRELRGQLMRSSRGSPGQPA